MMRIVSEIMVALSASPALSILAKGTVAIALGLTGAWFARRSRAAVRHALLASAFSILLALPIVSLIATPVPIAMPVAGTATVLPLFDNISAPSSGVSRTAGFTAAPAKSDWSLPPLSTMLLYAWFIGTALFAIPIVSGLLQIRSLRRYGLPWRHGQRIAHELAPGIRRHIEVLLHESLPGPMTAGVLHPVIILPADAQSWTMQDLARAIVHELEHVRRYDWAIHCLARIACAAYWFHPLVWVASGRLDLEAERSCDDAVLGSSEATAYADQLVGLAKRLRVQRSPALAMANRSDLSARVGALLDGKQARGPVGALLVALACVVAAAIVLTVSPLRMVAAPQETATPALQDIPQWDAVSVKRCATSGVVRAEGVGGGPAQSPDRLMVQCVTPQFLATWAYVAYAGGQPNAQKLALTKAEGFPGWASSEQFTIEAKAEGTPGLPMMRGPMLQTLLEDRFKLKVHEETREGKVFLLTVAAGGPKMKALEPGGCDAVNYNAMQRPNPCPYTAERDGNMGFDAFMSMSSMATLLTNGTRNPQSPLDAPVIDKTGLTGAYHVQIEYAPLDPKQDAPPALSIFTAIQKLGLKLEATKGPRQFLVFDHAERPTEN